jgi:hypothetical protein
MSQIFTIQDDKVVIKKLTVDALDGNIVHLGELSLSGPVEVVGTLTVDTLKVKHLETDGNINAKFGEWVAKSENELINSRLSWSWPQGTVQFGYEYGNKLWSNADFDLDAGKSYMINGVSVITETALADQIQKSKLKEVGTLKKLAVTGDTELSQFAFFNSALGRLGINTDEPNATFSVVDNNVEIIIGSSRDSLGQFGTHSAHDLEIITDNTSRITVKNNGQVIFGNPVTHNADVKIYGTLHVETVVTDNRIDRYSPLEFKTSRDRGIYGQGLIWTGTGDMRQLIMMAGPDRLFSSESLDLGPDNGYYIAGQPVLSSIGLGSTVTQSNLSKLGTLETLAVAGEATFMHSINASRAIINAKVIIFNDGDDFSITNGQLLASRRLSFKVSNDETYYADLQEIAIGNKENTTRPVKVFGPLSVGVNTPDDDVDLTVKGDIRFADKKFTTGTTVPTNGSFTKGDICWNSNPLPDGYIGWVCIDSGAPGQWSPFGLIARQ